VLSKTELMLIKGEVSLCLTNMLFKR